MLINPKNHCSLIAENPIEVIHALMILDTLTADYSVEHAMRHKIIITCGCKPVVEDVTYAEMLIRGIVEHEMMVKNGF
jgi:hypothetical protein